MARLAHREKESGNGENARNGRPGAGRAVRGGGAGHSRPRSEEMRIRVQACGVCHSDVVTVQGLFPIVQYPRVPGHEVIGVVDALGEGVHGWKVGARAGVGWFGGSCGYCRQCRRDNAFVCENVHEISGVTRDGGYATHMIAHVSAVAHVPDDLDAVESAPLLCAGVTTFNALRHTAAPGPATSSPFTASAASGISASSSRRGRAFAPSRSIAAATRRSWRSKLGASDYIDSDGGGPGQGADGDGRRQGDPRHRHRRQSDAGDLWRARAERGDDGDRRGRRP